jgi:hypothetical protein
MLCVGAKKATLCIPSSVVITLRVMNLSRSERTTLPLAERGNQNAEP